jgi:hypothetical protein
MQVGGLLHFQACNPSDTWWNIHAFILLCAATQKASENQGKDHSSFSTADLYRKDERAYVHCLPKKPESTTIGIDES